MELRLFLLFAFFRFISTKKTRVFKKIKQPLVCRKYVFDLLAKQKDILHISREIGVVI